MTPDPTLLDLADELEALAVRLRELFHLAADRELAEWDRSDDMEALHHAMEYADRLDWEAIHERRQEWRGRDRAERLEEMGVEGW